MNKRLVITILIGLTLLINCKGKKVIVTYKVPPTQEKKEIKKIDFFAPADSLITSYQIKNWLACNPLLDSLAIMYADSFKVQNAQTRLRYQDDYSAAQDKICVLSGLKGGYKEYKWIMNNIGNPKNKSVIEAAHASVY